MESSFGLTQREYAFFPVSGVEHSSLISHVSFPFLKNIILIIYISTAPLTFLCIIVYQFGLIQLHLTRKPYEMLKQDGILK